MKQKLMFAGCAALAMALRTTGKVLASAVGENGERMRTVTWNMPQAVGKDIYFRVVDDAIGGWGHVTLDDVMCEGVRGASDFAAGRFGDQEFKRR